MHNMLTGNELSSDAVEALRASSRGSVEISPYDPPYFFVRAFEELIGVGGSGFDDEPFRVIEAEDWIKIDLEERADDTLSNEVLFLEDFGLATMGDTEHICHINPIAIEMFYRPGGYFEEPTEKRNIRRLLEFMRDYVLPGQYWRAYYTAAGLPEDAGAGQRHEMMEVEAEWRSLVQEIGSERVEGDDEYYAES